MKIKKFLLISTIFLFAFYLSAQEVIENPENPLGKNSGRQVKLKEMMQIYDVGEKLYYEFPSNLKIAPNGSIFIKDRGQFIQFDSNGRFLRNLFKMGQGPGEMQSMGNYFFHGDNIIVHELLTKYTK